jgi:hypothetical protein
MVTAKGMDACMLQCFDFEMKKIKGLQKRCMHGWIIGVVRRLGRSFTYFA